MGGPRTSNSQQSSTTKKRPFRDAAAAMDSSKQQIRGFVTSFATIVVTCVRIGCLLPSEWFPWKTTSISTTRGGLIGWILNNPDISSLWTSILIRPFETWEHLREATAARNLFGSEFRDVYQGSFVHLPPLVLATMEPILDYVSTITTTPWQQSLVVGAISHLIDLWIAIKFIQIGNYVLQELRDPWEDDLQPKIPASLRAPAEHVFALSHSAPIEYTNELPAHKVIEPKEGEDGTQNNDNGAENGNSQEHKEATTNGDSAKDDPESPIFHFSDMPLLSAQLYYFSPFTALASGLGSTHHSFQNLWLLLLLHSLQRSCQGSASISLIAFWLSLASYMELHYVAFLIPISLWIQRRRSTQTIGSAQNKMHALWFFFAFYSLSLQGLSAALVGSSQYTSVLWSSYGHVLTWKHLHPNFSVLWYLNMEVFERFRTYFAVLIGGLPYLLLAPLTIRLHRYPMVLATVIWMLWTMFRPTSTLVDTNVALCFMALCPRSLARMRTGTTLVPAFAVTVPVTLYLVTLWLWLETFSGEANFTFFQCLGYSAFLAIFFLEFCGASLRRDKVLRFTEKLLLQKETEENLKRQDR